MVVNDGYDGDDGDDDDDDDDEGELRGVRVRLMRAQRQLRTQMRSLKQVNIETHWMTPSHLFGRAANESRQHTGNAFCDE